MRVKHYVPSGNYETYYMDIRHKCVVCGNEFGYSIPTDRGYLKVKGDYEIRQELAGMEVYYIKPYPCPRCKVYQPEMVDLMRNGVYAKARTVNVGYEKKRIDKNEIPWLGLFLGDAIWGIPLSVLLIYLFGKYGLWFYGLMIVTTTIGRLIRLLVVNPNKNVNISGVKIPGKESKFTAPMLFAYFIGIVLIALFVISYNKYTEPVTREFIYLEALTTAVYLLSLYINHKVIYVSNMYPDSIIARN